jgi:hypothetical protein
VPRKLFTSLLCPTEKVTEEQLATDTVVANLDRAVQTLNRRNFLSSLAAASAALGTAGVLTSPTRALAATPTAATPNIFDVLNFALNLEYLEANLYIAVSGSSPLTAEETGPGAGTVTGAPSKLQFDAQTQDTAANLALDERRHILTLRTAIEGLGRTPISQPPIDYSLGGKMSITTQAQFLAVARQFTAVGNSAYAGGAQYLVSNPLVLTAAAQILGAEAQHLGAVNYLCALQGVLSPPVDATDVPPVPPNTFFTITPTSAAMPALGPVRTPQQVLGIVYGVSNANTTTPPAGVTSGGFFPQGLNGSILST